jgi:hypothetical protein
MEVSAGRDRGTEWRIVDVGGSRSQVSDVLPFPAVRSFYLSSDGGLCSAVSVLNCLSLAEISITSRTICSATWVPFFDDGRRKTFSLVIGYS